MGDKEIRLNVTSEDFDLFDSLKRQKGILNNTEYFRYLLSKEKDSTSITAPEKLQKLSNNRLERESYLTMRLARASLVLIYRNNQYLEDGKSEEFRKIVKAKSLEGIDRLVNEFEEDFKNGKE